MLYQITLEDIPEKYMGWVHEVSEEFSDCFMVSTELMPTYSLDTNYALTFTTADADGVYKAKHVMSYISDKLMKATFLEENVNNTKFSIKCKQELFIRNLRINFYDFKSKIQMKNKRIIRKCYKVLCKMHKSLFN